MMTKLTAEEAWNNLEGGIDYADLGDDQKRLDRWFEGIKLSIAAEKDAEIAELKRELDHWINTSANRSDQIEKMRHAGKRLQSQMEDKDVEIAGLQAELDRLRPKPPKPRKTAGEKYVEILCKHHSGMSRWPDVAYRDRPGYQKVALDLGLTGDPEPPSDGELLMQLSGASSCWDWIAAEFLRLRTERDGGSRNVAEKQIAALVNFLAQDGTNRPLSLKHPVGSAIRYIKDLEKERDGGAT